MYKFSRAYSNEEVAHWLCRETGLEPVPPFTACAIVDDNGRIGGCWVWSEYTGPNVEVSIYAPRCITRRVLREGFDYAFNQLKVRRITQRVPLMNKKLNQIISKAGWKCEGILRHFYENDDAVIYGMIKSECKYLA